MANYTYATVIVSAADQSTAKSFDPDCEGAFNTGASADGNEPATSYFTCGPWNNDTLDALSNESSFPRTIRYGEDWVGALAKSGLVMVVPPQQQDGHA